MLTESELLEKYTIPLITIRCGKKQDKIKIERLGYYRNYEKYRLIINKYKSNPIDFNELKQLLKSKGYYDDFQFKIEELMLMEI